MMAVLLMCYAVGSLVTGLWLHDWRIIVASVAVLAGWPLLHESVREDKREHE